VGVSSFVTLKGLLRPVRFNFEKQKGNGKLETGEYTRRLAMLEWMKEHQGLLLIGAGVIFAVGVINLVRVCIEKMLLLAENDD